jgi:uncharacterized protein YndB with AHSA1/START domain
VPDIRHEIIIQAPLQRVYEALTTQEGLQSWWTSDTQAVPEVGSVAVFGFFNRSTIFRMRIDELTPAKRVRWSCEGDVDEWIDTEIRFDLEPDEADGSKLRFRHKNWHSTAGIYAQCNTTWGNLMFRLKAFAEGKNPGPLFTINGMAD